MLVRADIALNLYSSGGTDPPPRGFLPASKVGALPNTDEYRAALDLVLEQVKADLVAYELSTSVTLTPKQRQGALALARYYAADRVLWEAETGSTKDPEGATLSLSASDLKHWENIRTQGLAKSEQLLGPLERPAPTSGVMFAPISGGDACLYPSTDSDDWRNR